MWETLLNQTTGIISTTPAISDGDEGEDTVRRVWYFLCATLDEKSADGALTRYGFTPRQIPDRNNTP